MMQTTSLGKIILFLFLLPLALFGGVRIDVDKVAVYSGENVTFTITAEGSGIEFPNITAVDGYEILGTSSTNSVNIVNGSMSKSISRSYTFAPAKDVTIPSYAVKIDGQAYETQPQKISVLKPAASTNGEPIVLQMKLDKQEAYVGEPVRLMLSFKRKIDTKVDKAEINDPDLKDFWVKKLGDGQGEKSVEGDYLVQSFDYILFPKKAGDFTIPAAYANVGTAQKTNAEAGFEQFFNDPFFATMRMQWHKIYSNDAKLMIKPLPQNTYIYGDFNIKAKVDKTEVDANKPVNLTITVDGSGNIDDIAKFVPDIKDVILYADEPKITASMQDGKYTGTFSEHIAIVADRDYTIPPAAFSYFDAKQQKVVTKTTEAISIHVTGTPASQAPKLEGEAQPKLETSKPEKAQNETKIENGKTVLSNYWMLLIGVLMGIAVSMGVFFIISGKKAPSKEKKESSLAPSIKKAKNDRELFELLLPYAKENKPIEQTVLKLEENLYGGKDHKIDKKALIEALDEF